jgi:PAS domain S-box-containing protein
VSNAATKADAARGDHEDVPSLSRSSQTGHFIKWKRAKRPTALLHQAGYLLLGLVSFATVTGLYFWLDVPLVAAAFTYLVVLVLLSLVSHLSSLIVLSFIGAGCLSYFFAPPIYSFRVDYPQDLIIISAFAITSLVVNFLVTRVRVERETLRDANQRLEVTNEALRIENLERKRAEQALRESEARLAETQHELRQMIDTITILVVCYSPDARRDFVNAAWKQYTGLSDEQALGTDWSIVAHPDDLATGEKMWRDTLAKGEPVHTEVRLRRADGQYRWFAVDRVALRDESGKVIKWYATAYDIDEGKRAEQALRDSEYKLRQITETMPGLVWSNGPDGEPTHVNQRMLDYSGMQFEDFKHHGWEAFVHPVDYPETAEAFWHAIQTGTSYRGVMRLRRADGEFRWHHSRCEPLRDREGRVIQWYGLSVDIDERKQAEDQLRRSEAHLVEAERLSHTGAVAYNGTDILFASEETYRIWGFDPAQGLPSRDVVFQRIHPGDRDRLTAEVRREVGEKRRYSIGYRIVLPDGTVKHLETVGQPVFSASGRLVEIFATQTDVTERKRAEEALRESEAKFRDFAETASDWFCEMGPDYKFTLLSENAFGSGAADRIGTACWDHALDLETEPEKWRLLQETVFSCKPFRDFVYRGMSSDGSPMYVRASGKPLFDANGEFRGYRGTCSDVTEITRAQEALRESERSARSAIDGIPGLVAVLAPNGEVETVNRQVFEYFGRALEDLKNWGTGDLVHPEDLPHILELFNRAMASGNPFNFELRLRRLDGEYRWFENRHVPVRDDSGRIVGWYLLLMDIEDRSRALAQLEQMQSDFAHVNRVSMMGELAASLSHEITQPIGSARNNARAAMNFLDRSPPDLGEVREALGCVVSDTDRAGDIIDRIRDHIKKTPPRKGQFDLNEAIDEAIVLARSAIIKNGVWVQTRLSEGLFPIHCDRVQLQQVVLNLILNAAEAMGSVEAESRELLISTEQHHTGVLVAVRDSGPGIDPTHLERVFEAFYTTKSRGVGMGLSICRSIIDAHGGRLWAEVNEPRGAIFQFTLPAVQVGP